MHTLVLLIIRVYLLAFVHMHFCVIIKTGFDLCMIKICNINKHVMNYNS